MPSMQWRNISLDPNDPAVLSDRRMFLAAARHKEMIKDRIEYLKTAAAGKKVLDVGVVEHLRKSSLHKNWLHGHIQAVASECLGIDILEEEIVRLRNEGFNVAYHDITKAPIDSKFDLVIVGDVIEHLDNPSGLFRHIAAMLEPNGKLILSTPNPWYGNVLLKNAFEGEPFTDSADHVGWFEAGTLAEMANRSGLVLKKYSGVFGQPSQTLRSFLFFKAAPILMFFGIRRELFAKTMIYEFSLQ